MSDSSTVVRVRFGRRSQRGMLLGLSPARVCCIGVAVLTVTLGVFIGGASGLVMSAPVWASAIGMGFVRLNGSPLVETLPTAAHFLARRVAMQTQFRVSPDRPSLLGTMALPGDAASLRFLLDEPSGAVVVHDPHAATLTVVAHVEHTAYVLLSPDQQARRVAGWGRVLAALAMSDRCARVQVLETAAPDSGDGIVGWWKANGVDGSSWPATEYARLMESYAPAAATHRSLIAFSVKGPTLGSWKPGPLKGLEELRREMAAFHSGLRAAELRLVGWLSDVQLAAVIRGAYDPGTSPRSRRHALQTAGPMAVEEHWTHLHHDTGVSAVLWITEWPRIDVPADFLHALVFQPGVRKSFSITATPLAPRQAMREIRRAKVEHVTDAEQRARIGAIADLSDAAELEDVLDRERALLSGHADLRFTGLVTITAGTVAELDAAVAQVERAAVQCGCETRRLFGRQARAFTAAALPLARKVD
ncbi:SCO6880 family protein [Terrabacter terrigena]|uniref:SCO6880 family protein n=1 Tax=Terrabacter terrigena TaxID=574718 RepID=A0ABW3MZB7_9MICO